MSGPFPSMVCNEPPPLDSEEEDSESFADFPSAGLKLDILGEPSPQQSPIKSSLKKTLIENGVNTSEEPTPDQSPFESPMKRPLISNGLNENSDTSIPESAIKSCLEQPLVNKCGNDELDMSPSDSSIEISATIETLENGFEVDEDSPKQSLVQYSSCHESFENGLNNEVITTSSPPQSPIQSSFTPFFEIHPGAETGVFENSSVHCSLNDDLFVNSIDIDESVKSFPQSPNQSPLSDELVDNFEDSKISEIYSVQLSSDCGSKEIAVTSDLDLKYAQDASAQLAVDQMDDDFGDFEAFQINTTGNTADESSTNNMKTSYIGKVEIEDEEFGNFAEATFAPIQSNTPLTFNTRNQNQIDSFDLDDSEGFGDFEDFQASSASNPTTSVPSTVLGGIENKLEQLIKSVFSSRDEVKDTESKAIVPLDKALTSNSIDASDEWMHVQDFEGSQGLQFKWSNCAVHQRMLSSLKIDTTAVMYTGKWGTIEVPRFAASIVESPLQPKVYTNAIDGELLSSVPAAQSVNETASSRESAAKSQKSQSGKRGQSGSEAQQILDQLPDLSFMRAKTLVFASQVQE